MNRNRRMGEGEGGKRKKETGKIKLKELMGQA